METINPRFDWSMALLAVVEHGSFTAAAEALACSKAHLSKQVGRLEQALGVQLLYRTTRRLALTDAGSAYLDYCRTLRSTLDEAQRTVSGLKREAAGRVRLTAPTTFGSIFLCDLLLAFRRRYPRVDIELDLSREQRDLIEDGFDLAIRSSRALDERLVAKPLSIGEEWLVAAPSFLDGQERPRTPRDLVDRPCLVNSHFKDDGKWLFWSEDGKESVPVSSWLAVNDYPLIRRLALAGAGFARLPRYLVESDVQAGSLERVLDGFELPHFPLYLVFPQRTPQPPKLRVLIDFIHDWFTAR